MFEAFVIEQTPVTTPIYTQVYFEGPKTSDPVQERRAARSVATSLRGFEIPTVGEKIDGTVTLADLSDRREARRVIRSVAPQPGIKTSVDKARNDRVSLLARKYAGHIDREANARLEILTARLNQLVPTVTPSTIDRVSVIVGVANRASEQTDTLRAKYNF
jgi:hypothetical protein